jgi:AraC family transcriptional regulator
MSLAGVPNQVCSQCPTNRIEPPVSNRAHIIDRADGASDGMCRTGPDARRRRVLSRAWRRRIHQVDLPVVHRTEFAVPPLGAEGADAVPDQWLGLGLDSRDTLAADIQTLQTPQFLLTRMRCREGTCDISMPMPQEEGFIVSIQLRELAEHELWLQNRLAHSGRYPEHGICIFNLEHQPRFRFATSFDSLQFHIRWDALDTFANEHSGLRIDALSWPHGARDQTFSHLASALLPALRNPHWANQPFLDHIGKALIAHFARAYGGAHVETCPSQGGLAPWQERRCKELVTARIATQISLEELANECRLSVSHFGRAFKQTIGEPPHRWLLRQRVKAAKKMLAGPEKSIAEIAIACGFADQSHLTRVFAGMIGVPPGAWRRRHDALLPAGA